MVNIIMCGRINCQTVWESMDTEGDRLRMGAAAGRIARDAAPVSH